MSLRFDAADPIAPNLLPLPRELRRCDGAPLAAARVLTARYVGARSARLEAAVDRCLSRAPGGDPAGQPALPLSIACASAAGAVPGPGDDESYRLRIDGDGVRITAPEEWGVLRALATLTQLRSAGTELPALEIADAPRFPWRGLMVDAARHFLPQAALLRTLDAMEVFKLNVLHLHLSDDQAFRFPSRKFPRLASREHYRRAELDALVRAAADRGIRVVPELDVPGHTTSWLTAYPEWGNRPARPTERFGVHHECLDPTRPEVVEAVGELFAELAGVFPDPYLHIGGDEVHPAWWSGDERIGSYMREHGLADAADLQAEFNVRVHEHVRRLGRRTLAWDEVLHAILPEAVTVQAWRGATARDRALAAGHDCVLSAPYYLDLCYPADVHYAFDPAASEAELTALEDRLREDPRFAHIADGIAWTRHWRDREPARAAAKPGRLLGAEACLWAELVDARVLDVRLWSRMPALAERFWSPAECRDEGSMYERLETVLARLPAWAGVDVAGDARRLAAAAGVAPDWQPLVELLEPVKWYGRLLGEEALRARLAGREMPKSRPYRVDTPLDRVVDALPPESFAARRLAELCRRDVAGDAEARTALTELAECWIGLPADGGPAELAEAAERLRELGRVVLELQDVAGAAGASAAAPADVIARAAAPIGEYLLAAAPVLADWVRQRQAARGDA